MRLALAGVLALTGCERDPRAEPPPHPIPPLPPLPPNATKRATVEAFIRRGPTLVHLDARRRGVEVPAKHKSDPDLVLRFGLELDPPIHDLSVDDTAIAGTLLFDGKPQHVVVPWPPLFAASVEGQTDGTLWPEDVPDDLPDSSERDR